MYVSSLMCSLHTELSVGSACSSDREEADPSQPRGTMSPDGSPLSSDEEKASVWVCCMGVCGQSVMRCKQQLMSVACYGQMDVTTMLTWDAASLLAGI